MSPSVLGSKLQILYQILQDLKPHLNLSREGMEFRHYEIERQVQLCVDLCISLGRRKLILEGVASPPTAREVFLSLAKKRLISKRLGDQLSDSVGLRNLVVHEYGKIDYDLFFDGLRSGYQSFLKFTLIVEKWLN